VKTKKLLILLVALCATNAPLVFGNGNKKSDDSYKKEYVRRKKLTKIFITDPAKERNKATNTLATVGLTALASIPATIFGALATCLFIEGRWPGAIQDKLPDSWNKKLPSKRYFSEIIHKFSIFGREKEEIRGNFKRKESWGIFINIPCLLFIIATVASIAIPTPVKKAIDRRLDSYIASKTIKAFIPKWKTIRPLIFKTLQPLFDDMIDKYKLLIKNKGTKEAENHLRRVAPDAIKKVATMLQK